MSVGTLARAVTPATKEQWSIETLTTAGTPGTLTAETPGALTVSRKNYSNKSQLEHQGTPRAGTPELLETSFTEGMLTRIGTTATAGENTSSRRDVSTVVGKAVTAETVVIAGALERSTAVRTTLTAETPETAEKNS